MTSSFTRIAIITGATSGIGEATARAFIAAGFGVIGNGRTAAKLIALEKELGPSFHGVSGDTASNSVLEKLFASAIQHFGKPADIVIANAGRGLAGSVKDADASQFDELIKTNISATLALLQKAAQKMTSQQNAFPKAAADIVIIGSVVGRNISPFSAVYGATKFAVHAMAESLRRDMSPKGIRVSLVEPGFVLSGFQSVANYSDGMVQGFKDKCGPLLSGEDVADAIRYIVTRPPHVHIGDLVIRPTRQDYP